MQPDPDKTRFGRRGVSTREQVRLLIIFVFTIFVTGMVWSGLQGGGTRVENPILPQDPTEDLVPAVVEAAPVTPWEAPPLQVREATPEDRVRVYPQALGLLAEKVWARSHDEFKRDPTRPDPSGFAAVGAEKLTDETTAAAWRGRRIEVKGTLLRLRPVEAARWGLEGGRLPEQIWEGRLDAQGERVAFLLLDRVQELQINLGSEVRVQGVFFRLRDTSEGEDWVSEAVVLAKKCVPVVPLRRLERLPEGLKARLMADLKKVDLGVEQPTPQRDPSFFAITGFLLGTGEEYFAANPPAVLRGTTPVTEPARYLLEPVRVKGKVVYLRKESFEYEESRPGDSPDGILHYWHAIVADPVPEINAPVAVFIPAEDAPSGLEVGRRIELDGIFYRLNLHTNRKGQPVRMPAVVSLGSVRSFAPPPPIDLNRYLVVFIGLGLVLVLALVFLLARDRKKGKVLEERIRERRRARRREEALAPKSDPGPRA